MPCASTVSLKGFVHQGTPITKTGCMVENDVRSDVASQIVTIYSTCRKDSSFISSYEGRCPIHLDQVVFFRFDLEVHPRIPVCMNIYEEVMRIGNINICIVVREGPQPNSVPRSNGINSTLRDQIVIKGVGDDLDVSIRE